ncbi:AI-2E family transporter [Haliovirga abyssi]|uniref:AI-2E family transporter n=1 Tax=Haliovirga abyssi TaxID=2996794 RepID=A0AAU9DD24_9FUSO|nr:AI-2E family transporter [Haliovirga abyssi]BDU50063.1 AI-2E family transporter [Haliovirga abyssi]
MEIKKSYFQINFSKLFFYLFLIFVMVVSIYATIPLLRSTLIGFIIAYLLEPLVLYLERKNINRLLSVIVIFSIFIIGIWYLIIGIKSFFPSPKEIINFIDYIVKNTEKLKYILIEKYNYINWNIIFDNIISSINTSSEITSKIPKILSSIAGLSSLFFIIPFTTFFFLLDGSRFKKWLLKLIPNRYFEITYTTLKEVDSVFGNYIRGTLLESLIIGVMTFIGFFIIGFPFNIALITGAVSGLANAVPYIGPLLGAVIGVILHILKIIPKDYVPVFGISVSILGVLVVVGIVQIFDNIAVKPTVIGKSVDLHPLVVVLGILAGGKMFGFVGIIAAIPVIAIIKVIVETLYNQLSGYNMLSKNLAAVVTEELKEID